MSFVIKVISIVLVSGMFIQGCVSSNSGSEPIQIEPDMANKSRDAYEAKTGKLWWKDNSNRIALPQNYSTKNYDKFRIAAWFYPSDVDASFEDKPIDSWSTMMETELSKLKRFTILSRNMGMKGSFTEKDFQDMLGQGRKGGVRYGAGLNADYTLSAAVSASSQEFGRGSSNELIYIIRVDYQLVDLKTNEIVEADTAEGRAKRTIIRTPSGKIIGGFDPKDADAALEEAAINSLKIIGNKIGNKLPIGGKVIGMYRNSFQIDKGYEEGVMGKQIMIVYDTSYGVDMPVAVAEVSPSDHESRGTIFRWSDDPEVEELVQRMKTERDYFRYETVFAVSDGMPLPPEWDKNYSN